MITLAMTLALLTGPGDIRPHHFDVNVTSPQVLPHPGHAAFQASKILDVQFEAAFVQRLAGEHLLEFKVYTPRDKLYQVLTVPFTGNGDTKKMRHVPGYPQPLREHGLRPGAGSRYRVTAILPVAGTWIMTNSLYGRWRVEAHLDGDPLPSARETFTINP
jgi:hypothetical protein